MRFDFHFVFEKPLRIILESVPAEALANINIKLNTIIMTLQEAQAAILAIVPKLNEAKTEILALIETLRNTNPELSPEASAALTSIAGIANTLADIVPNPPPAE